MENVKKNRWNHHIWVVHIFQKKTRNLWKICKITILGSLQFFEKLKLFEKMFKKIAEITTYKWYYFFRKKIEIFEKTLKLQHLGESKFSRKIEWKNLKSQNHEKTPPWNVGKIVWKKIAPPPWNVGKINHFFGFFIFEKRLKYGDFEKWKSVGV